MRVVSSSASSSRPNHVRPVSYSCASEVWKKGGSSEESVTFTPASRSFGLQVAALAGVPRGVIRNAEKHLAELESADRAEAGVRVSRSVCPSPRVARQSRDGSPPMWASIGRPPVRTNRVTRMAASASATMFSHVV